MENEDIFKTLDNCWLALCQQMRAHPEADTQRAMNLLARILNAAKAETRKRKTTATPQVSIGEWLAWLEKEATE